MNLNGIDLSAIAPYKPYAMKALAAYGGVSAAFDFGAARIVKPAVDAIMAVALKNPISKMILVKYEPQVLGLFDVARDEVRKTIDAAKAAAAPPAPAPAAVPPVAQPNPAADNPTI